MPKDIQDDRKLQDMETLRHAFEAFNETTRHLQESYEKLEKRIQALDLELERKNSELENNLKEKEEVKNYLSHILESLTTGVIVMDPTGVVTTCNEAAGDITGHPPDECLNRQLSEFMEAGICRDLQERLSHQPNETFFLEEEMNTPHRGRLRVRVSASPFKGASRQTLGTVLILQDITEFKRLEEEAQRNDRLRAMGEMAAGIAHEIRNPMGGIQLFASMLQKDLESMPKQQSLAEHIQSGIRNMDRTISSLLLFAKSPEPARRQCDINRLLEDLLKSTTQVQWPGHVEVECDLDTKPVLATGDRELLEQVFLNLIRNALQAMPEEGTLHLQTRFHPVPEGESLGRPHVTVTLTDTGIGIPAHELKHIFNPFFSTKDQGTGLGLAIAHNILKAHQGTIDVESREGDGTTFTVKIPGWSDD